MPIVGTIRPRHGHLMPIEIVRWCWRAGWGAHASPINIRAVTDQAKTPGSLWASKTSKPPWLVPPCPSQLCLMAPTGKNQLGTRFLYSEIPKKLTMKECVPPCVSGGEKQTSLFIIRPRFCFWIWSPFSTFGGSHQFEALRIKFGDRERLSQLSQQRGRLSNLMQFDSWIGYPLVN